MKYISLGCSFNRILSPEETLLFSVICSWSKYNENKGYSNLCVDDRYCTRLSYTKLSNILDWWLPETTIRRNMKSLEEKGFIKVIHDNLSNKFGNLYTYTDKVFDIITKDEFNDMCKKYNSSLNLKFNSSVADESENDLIETKDDDLTLSNLRNEIGNKNKRV